MLNFEAQRTHNTQAAHIREHKNLVSCVRLLYNAVIIVNGFTIEKGGVFMDRTAYKNRHIKEHYDRINFVIPKGEKDRIKKIL